jgi:hypothetical protein
MERSWSLPVAQALQRHTGSWKASLPSDGAADSRGLQQPIVAMQEIAKIAVLDIIEPASDSSPVAPQITTSVCASMVEAAQTMHVAR